MIFEFGLFTGALGIENCYFVVPRNSPALHLPTDLLGLSPLTYADDRSDGNLVAALGPACNRIRRQIRPRRDSDVMPNPYALARQYADTWDEKRLREARDAVRELALDNYSPEHAAQKPMLARIFAFLESMADGVLLGRIDETAARASFEQAVLSVWPHIYVLLAPPNHAADWWEPLPSLAQLYDRWRTPQST